MSLAFRRLKMLREKKQLTTLQLARELKMPQATIDELESGRVSCTEAQLKKFAEFYEVTPDYILWK